MSTSVASTPMRPRPRASWIVLALLLGGFWIWGVARNASQKPDVSYPTAYGWIKDGKVAEVTLKGDEILGQLRAPEQVEGRTTKVFTTRKPDDKDLVPLLRDK